MKTADHIFYRLGRAATYQKGFVDNVFLQFLRL